MRRPRRTGRRHGVAARPRPRRRRARRRRPERPRREGPQPRRRPAGRRRACGSDGRHGGAHPRRRRPATRSPPGRNIATNLAPVAFVSIHHNAAPDGPSPARAPRCTSRWRPSESRRLAGLIVEEVRAALAPFPVAWASDVPERRPRPASVSRTARDFYGVLRRTAVARRPCCCRGRPTCPTRPRPTCCATARCSRPRPAPSPGAIDPLSARARRPADARLRPRRPARLGAAPAVPAAAAAAATVPPLCWIAAPAASIVDGRAPPRGGAPGAVGRSSERRGGADDAGVSVLALPCFFRKPPAARPMAASRARNRPYFRSRSTSASMLPTSSDGDEQAQDQEDGDGDAGDHVRPGPTGTSWSGSFVSGENRERAIWATITMTRSSGSQPVRK